VQRAVLPYALMTISMILSWGAVIFGIVALVRRRRPGTPARRDKRAILTCIR
jgi:hypothetical protein